MQRTRYQTAVDSLTCSWYIYTIRTMSIDVGEVVLVRREQVLIDR